MIDDITTTIKAQLYDRITSPLSGAFSLSWAIYNWKFITILFSDLKATEKITYISLNIFPNKYEILLHGFAIPLATAMALLIVYPIPAKLFYTISQHHKKTLKEVQQKFEDEMPMLNAEASKLRHDSRETQKKYELEIAEKSRDSHETKSRLKQAELTASSLEQNNNALQSEIKHALEVQQSLERSLGESNAKLDHLTALTLSLTPKITPARLDRDKITLTPPTPYQEPRPRPDTSRPASDITIESALNAQLYRKSILQEYSPRIHVSEGRIFLNLQKPKPRAYIISVYDTSEIGSIIDAAFATLQTLQDEKFSPEKT